MAPARFESFARSWRDQLKGSMHALLAAGFHGVASALLHPITFVAFFVSQLSDSPRDVALVAVIATVTWYVPDLLTTWLAVYYHRVYPVVIAASFVRLVSAGMLATIVLRADASDAGLVRQLLLSFVAYQLSSAALAPAANHLLARSAPVWHRARLFRHRYIVAGIGAIVASAVAVGALGDDAPTFPRAFGLLFLAAAMAVAAESWFLLRLREPTPRHTEGRTAKREPARLKELLASRGFRRFLLFRVVLALAAIADPFLIVHGMREIEPSARFLGLYAALFTIASLVSGLAVTNRVARGSVRPVWQSVALLRFTAPILAVLIPFLNTSGTTDTTVTAWLFATVFLALGVTMAAHGAATLPTLIALAPNGSRGAAISLLNAVLGTCALSPLLGSRVVERRDITALLVVAATTGFLAVLFSGALGEPVRRTRRRRQWVGHRTRSTTRGRAMTQRSTSRR